MVNDQSWCQYNSEKGAKVMLDIKMNPELLAIGQYQEITDCIQKLRKTSGISIDDQIEIFYEFTGKASTNSQLGFVMQEHA